MLSAEILPRVLSIRFCAINNSQVSNVLYGNKEMKNKSKNADDSPLHSPAHHQIKYSDKMQELNEDEDIFQDEGFLDSYDLDKNSSTMNDDCH